MLHSSAEECSVPNMTLWKTVPGSKCNDLKEDHLQLVAGALISVGQDREVRIARWHHV